MSVSKCMFLVFPQLRKPTVEKIRRERINSSIEKLKSLLGQEFLKQQSRLQTGESWYPGDDAGFLETPAALPESLGLQLYCSSWRTLQMCAGGRQLPVSVSSADRSPTEDCWSTSCTRSPTQRTTHECRLRSVHQPHRAAAKSKLWRSGDPGRATSTRMIYQTEFIMPVWDWHGLKL